MIRGEYKSAELNKFLVVAGIQRENSIRDTPLSLDVAERMNRTLDKGMAPLLSQSGLSWMVGGCSSTFPLEQNRATFIGHCPAHASRLVRQDLILFAFLQLPSICPLTEGSAQGFPIACDYEQWHFAEP